MFHTVMTAGRCPPACRARERRPPSRMTASSTLRFIRCTWTPGRGELRDGAFEAKFWTKIAEVTEVYQDCKKLLANVGSFSAVSAPIYK